jgi:hypothetical protein
MTARSNQNAFARCSRIGLGAIALLFALASTARAQRTGGSIGVSLTILTPVATQAVRVLGFDVDRNGVATLQTSGPTSGPVSQIVMTSVERASATVSTSRPTPALVPAGGASTRYLVDLGAHRSDARGEPVQLRLRYLTVAGT